MTRLHIFPPPASSSVSGHGDSAGDWADNENRDADLEEVLQIAERSGVSPRYPGDETAWWTAQPERDYRRGNEITCSLHMTHKDELPLLAAESEAISRLIADGCRLPEEVRSHERKGVAIDRNASYRNA